MTRDKKIKLMMEGSCEEGAIDQLSYVLSEILRYQADADDFLRDALTMVDDEAIDDCFNAKVDSAEVILDEEDIK